MQREFLSCQCWNLKSIKASSTRSSLRWTICRTRSIWKRRSARSPSCRRRARRTASGTTSPSSQQVQQRIKQLQTKCEKYDKLCSSWDDLFTMCEMALEEDDASMLEELKAEYDTLSEKLEEMRLSTLLTGEYDANNAILTFHAGAGGTEAQDWAQMLYRMYTMLGGAPRLHLYAARLSGRRRGRHQVRHHQDRGRQRLRLSQKRKRCPPPCAHLPVRRLRPPPHQLCRRGGHARDRRGQQRDRAARRRDQDGRVPLLRRGRPEGQQDLLRRASDPPADRHRRFLVRSSAATSRTSKTASRMLRAKLAEIKEREHLEKICGHQGRAA